jgi:DNA-binding transcriptional MerR regulator
MAEPVFMTPKEVAALFRVDARTLMRWDIENRFPEGTVIRTLGGHRRYKADTIRALTDSSPLTVAQDTL